MAGGYKVNDIVKYQGQHPYEIKIDDSLPEDNEEQNQNQNQNQVGGKPLSDLGVPSGLFYLTQRAQPTYVPFNNHQMIPDDLYENLLDLVKFDPKKRSRTRKHKRQSNKTKSKKVM